MDEVFGADNLVGTIGFQKTAGATSSFLPSTFDYLLWFGKSHEHLKYRQLYMEKTPEGKSGEQYRWIEDPAGK